MSRRYDYGGGGFSFGGSLSTVVKLLIAWNVIFFFVQLLSGRFVRGLDEWIIFYLGLTPGLVLHGYVWQLVTYMFLHGGLFHILFNMLALWMFGSELEYLWGSRRFLQYYFFTGIGAGITNVLMQPHSLVPTIGASGAIYGLLLAFGMFFPDRQILLYFLFPIRAKYFVILFGAIEFLSLFARDGIAHFAHLGGLLFGFLFIKGIPMRWFRRRRRPKGTKIVDIRSFRDPDDRDSRWR
ncbi:MAG: rhomboid family intramembrane serine protease [Candidatus Eisenbacteria bacterium]|nr:rhomboid family intramembrane serine protease [Candidatus Eisenbacteria bacterium]